MSTQTKTYSEKLKDPRWQKKRLEILQRDNWGCKLCGDSKSTLHVHHLKYTASEPHEEPEENLISYCEDCHSVVEVLKNVLTVDKVCKLGFSAGQKRLIVWDKEKNIFFMMVDKDNVELRFGFHRDDFKILLNAYNG